MKPLRLACFAFMAATFFVAVCAGADMPTIGQDYGTNAESGAQFYTPKPALGAPAAGNATASASPGNTTPPNPALGLPGVNPGNVTTPAGNTTAETPSANGVPAVTLVTPNAGPDLSSLPMPATMDKIDNDHPLAPRDRFVYQVVEDRDSPVLLTVDRTGRIDVPYLGWFSIVTPKGNMTLQEMALAVKKELTKTDPATGKQNLYKQATVLALPYPEPPRSEINVLGSVMHSGPIQIAPDSTLTLWDAVYAPGAGGGPASGADTAHVTLIHRDSANLTADPNHTYNLDDMAKNGTISSVMVESGDIINVPSKTDTSGYIFVSGEVNAPGKQVLPAGARLTVTEAIVAAGGFSKWSNDTVTIYRVGKDGKATALPDFDVDQVLVKGHTEQDIPLQNGDVVHANQSFFSHF